MCRRIILIATLFVSCYSNKDCVILKNAEVTVLSSETGFSTTAIQNEEQSLENVYKIKIQGKNIPVICKHSFQNLNKLDNLIIDASGVKTIHPSAFENLASLRNLIITNNEIAIIETAVFGDLLIRKLNLSYNEISIIKPMSFENMMNLEILDLSYNKLTTFENNWFKYTPKLYRLDFMYNSIQNIPENAFVNIIKYKQKKNDLELWFAHNVIQTIDKRAFNEVDKIEDLWLNNNSLSHIDVEVFARVQRIRTLFLSHNQLTCFNDQFLQTLRVEDFDIDGNPIDCTCIEKIKEWGKQKNTSVNALSIRFHCAIQKAAFLKCKIVTPNYI